MKLTLIRGLPGSGKSTMAKTIGCLHLEADMFFMKNGEYAFEPGQLKSAHEWCQSACYDALERGMDVVVSNTFTQHWEMKAYQKMGQKFGAEVEVIVCEDNYGSIHNVPMEAIERMKSRWEA